LKKANLIDPSKCLFIDDDRGNVDAAKLLGWKECVHFREQGFDSVEEGGANVDTRGDHEGSGVVVINDLEQLRTVWAHIFKR
jgi:pyrimidine and pyridine-specific 5'-nucleotidase